MRAGNVKRVAALSGKYRWRFDRSIKTWPWRRSRPGAECLNVCARETDWSPVADAAGNEADVRREIDEIDATLRRLRGEHAGTDDSVGDRADAAADLTGYEEEQALVENLERRRAELMEQLEGK